MFSSSVVRASGIYFGAVGGPGFKSRVLSFLFQCDMRSVFRATKYVQAHWRKLFVSGSICKVLTVSRPTDTKCNMREMAYQINPMCIALFTPFAC